MAVSADSKVVPHFSLRSDAVRVGILYDFLCFDISIGTAKRSQSNVPIRLIQRHYFRKILERFII